MRIVLVTNRERKQEKLLILVNRIALFISSPENTSLPRSRFLGCRATLTLPLKERGLRGRIYENTDRLHDG